MAENNSELSKTAPGLLRKEPRSRYNVRQRVMKLIEEVRRERARKAINKVKYNPGGQD